MQPEMKLEGDVLKINVNKSVVVDTDKDGVHAVKASVALEIEADGSEVMKELFKSSTLVEKAKEMLKIGQQ